MGIRPMKNHIIHSSAKERLEAFINIVQIIMTRLCLFFFPNGFETYMVVG